MVGTMFVQFNRTTITAVWILVFGLLGLLWSALSVAMGVLLVMVVLAGPVVMLILSSEPSVTLARVVPRVYGSQAAR
jgi:hypothetical protein